MGNLLRYKSFTIILLFVTLFFTKNESCFAQQDTLTVQAIVYGGDTMSYQVLPSYFAYSKYDASTAYIRHNREKRTTAAWNELRVAIYVTYPYAKRCGIIINDINYHLARINGEE